ncbi:glycosyltransferase [bacterium]|nr:glycosyltransferase [bacterium]
MITALTVNYNTPDFLERLLISFRKYYDLSFVVIDGSDESQYQKIKSFPDKYQITLIHFGYNIHHGPGLAYGINYIETEQILLLDSDLIVLKNGFVEDLQSKLRPDSYGIGDVQTVDERGFNAKSGIKYLHPACALINRKIVLKYAPPVKHGAPMIEAMKEITTNILQHEHWVANDFRSVKKVYVSHDWMGTVNRTGGYHL